MKLRKHWAVDRSPLPNDAIAVRVKLAKDTAFVAKVRAALESIGPALSQQPKLLPSRYTELLAKENDDQSSDSRRGACHRQAVPRRGAVRRPCFEGALSQGFKKRLMIGSSLARTASVICSGRVINAESSARCAGEPGQLSLIRRTA